MIRARVVCDVCGDGAAEESTVPEARLTARREGWQVAGDRAVCPDCLEMGDGDE